MGVVSQIPHGIPATTQSGGGDIDKCIRANTECKTSKIRTSIFLNTHLFKIIWDTLDSENGTYS